MNTPAPHYFLVSLNRNSWVSQTHVWSRTFSPQPFNLPIGVDFVVLQDREFRLLSLVLDLLWRGVDLLLSLLRATS